VPSTASDSSPRFTVIIPTKDRAAYLYHTLRTCSQQEYDNLEIVVADDGSRDDTRAVVEAAAQRDARIRYTSPGANGVGMLDNFEFALDQAKEGFVIALGGDDGLLPHAIRDMRDRLVATRQEMLAWPTPVYFYPGTRSGEPQLVLHLRRGRLYDGEHIVSSDDFLRRQAREYSYVWDLESPMFYVKGVVSTRLIAEVRRRSPGNRFYSCATPDGYSGIVLAGEVKSWAFSGKPLSMHGISPSSAGFAYLAGTADARKQSETFFATARNRPMHAELGSQPYSPLISLMTADYLLTTRDLPGWPGVRTEIDYRKLLLIGLAEVSDALFSRDRVARELRILNGVAEHHGLGEFFRSAARKARRNVRSTLEGNAVSPSRLYLDPRPLGIENIFDAAYFAYLAHNAASARVSSLWAALANSARYKVASLRKGPRLVEESEWNTIFETA
jgi:glycosyltransferase involved in cell wall biosynthesis